LIQIVGKPVQFGDELVHLLGELVQVAVESIPSFGKPVQTEGELIHLIAELV
jgi:hypothetical protein